MKTEVFFIEGLYLYTEVGSSGRGVLASYEQGSLVPFVLFVSEGHSRGVRDCLCRAQSNAVNSWLQIQDPG